MEGQIIRAYMLEVGDVFQLGQVRFRVYQIEGGAIYSRYVRREDGHGKNGGCITMGANSQERVLLITNKINKNGNQNQSNHFSRQ